MRGVWLIAWRELRAYLLAPIAYGVIAVFLALSGFFFFQHLADYSIKSLQLQYPGTQELLAALHPNQHILQPLFDQMSIFLLFVTPILTMRPLAPSPLGRGRFEGETFSQSVENAYVHLLRRLAGPWVARFSLQRRHCRPGFRHQASLQQRVLAQQGHQQPHPALAKHAHQPEEILPTPKITQVLSRGCGMSEGGVLGQVCTPAG
jgi:hypothetical protein